MVIPRAVLSDLILDVVKDQNERNLSKLVDVIVESVNELEQYNLKISENRGKIDKQHEETMHVIELMKKGFESVDKRFDDVNNRFEELIHNMDKRFESVDKRFDDVNRKFKLLTWLIGIGFVSMNVLLLVLKFFN